MGRKSTLVENAFALRQQQIMIRDDKVMTERERIERVEELVRDEARANRQRGRKTAEEVEAWSKAVADNGGRGLQQGGKDEESKGEDAGGDKNDATTLPSILHERPHAIRALNIWSARLSSTPYARWTIGASTALDHWIAREVLQMSEQAWQRVLEGGGTDAYQVANGKGGDSDTLPGGESRRGLLGRMRDIVVVRGALFPETLDAAGPAYAGAGDLLRGDLDDDLASSGKGVSATEKSIDELLASLGVDDDDDDDGTSWKFDDNDDDDDGKKKEEDTSQRSQWRCRGVDNGKEGPWRWWAYRGVVGGATSTRWRSKRAAVGMSQRCRGGRHGSSCAALTGQEGSGVGLKKRSDNQHVVGGGVWQGAGVGGGTVSARVDVFVQQ